jgi:plastocyanin
MTLRSVILSSLFAAALYSATLTGQVELRDSREKAVQRGQDYSGVVIWLEPAPTNGGGAAAPKVPEPAGPLRATMLQKNKKFVPHVLAVRRGTQVDFPNQDPIFHNAFSNFSGQIFDVGLYKPGSTRSVGFNRNGVVRVFCNIHSAMSAVIVVMDTPWFATTANDGSFRISNVPPGQYRLKVFHERALAAELNRQERTISLTADGAAPVHISVSESGYLPTPHTDKHGRPYGNTDDAYRITK